MPMVRQGRGGVISALHLIEPAAMRRPTDQSDLAAATPSASATPDQTTPAAGAIGAALMAEARATANGVGPAQLDVADAAVGGPAARAGGLTGSGVKIGIISDSYNLLGGAAAAEQAGLLPSNGVTVLEEGPVGGADEGQAIAEILHATAPGAQLYFYSGFYSATDFAAGIKALQAAGCKIIVDDVSYPDEPMFQNAGPVDTAVAAAVSAGVDYFTAVGNDGRGFYQASVATQTAQIAGLGTVQAQTFAGGATTQTVTIPAGNATTLALDWNAPYGATNADPITVTILSGSTIVAASTQAGNEPVVTVDFPILGVDKAYTVAITYNSGVPKPSMIKYVLEGGGSIGGLPNGQGSGSAYGQSLLPGVNAVGAVDVANTPIHGGTPTPESFSSTGGGQLLYSANGTPLSPPAAANGPDFLAPDGAATSSINPFFGTSAAAPVAAATAALMLQANPTLANADITTLLEDSALPAGAANVAGAGLIQANLAASYARTGVISGSPQAVIRGTDAACTIQGGGGAHWLLAGSGATLIQSQGTDSIQTGAGADTVDLTGASAQLFAGSGPTWVRTLGGADTVVGGSGALTVSGGAGGGVIFGGTSGGDRLVAGQEKTIVLSQGTNDTVSGIGDGDLLYASNAGQDTVTGGTGTEILVGGTGGTNVFLAGNGTPLVAPEGSNAVVTFGTGDATALCGSGAEALQVVNGQAGGFEAVYDFDPIKDMLLLSGFSAEQAAAAASVAHQYDVGGNSWLKLPDGTVIAFVGLSHLSAGNVTYG